MAVHNKTRSQPIYRLQAYLEDKISSVPAFKKAANKVKSSSAFAAIKKETKRGRKHLEAFIQEFPRDKKSAKTYLQAQRVKIEKWGSDLRAKAAFKPARAKSKAERSRENAKGKTA